MDQELELQFIKESFQENKHYFPLEKIDHAYITGSIVRGVFYENWSDIDIVIVFYGYPDYEELQSIHTWQRQLQEHFNCKIGIDFVDIEMLKGAIVDRVGLEHFSALQAYHIDQRKVMESGLLYGDIRDLPVIERAQVINASVLPNLINTQTTVYESVMRNEFDFSNLVPYRQLVKNTLYLFQSVYMSETGELVTDYDTLTSLMSEKYRFPSECIMSTLHSLKTNEDPSRFVNRENASDCLRCYQAIEKYIKDSKNE